MPKLSLTIIVTFSLFVANGQFKPEPDWRFDNFSGQNNFISIDVQGLLVDRHGYVWATSDGVSRFDGISTVTYNSFANTKGGIKNNYTDNIVEDPEGRIWVGSGGGICYYSEAGNTFNYLQLDSSHPINYAFAFCIKQNNLWFVCNYGLARVNLQTLKVTLTSLRKFIDPLCTYAINDSTLWVSGREKLFSYNMQCDTYKDISITYNNLPVTVTSIIKNSNTCFLGTTKGLFLLDTVHTSPQLLHGTENLVVPDLAFHPADIKKTFLLVATDGKGLLIYNTHTKTIEYNYLHDDTNPYSLSSNSIISIHVARGGVLWLGTSLGLSMVDAYNQHWKMRYLQKGASNLAINKIKADKYDSLKIWASLTNAGMACINWDTKKIEQLFDKDLKDYGIRDFVQVNKNSWILMGRNELLEWEPAKGVVRRTGPIVLPGFKGVTVYARCIIQVGPETYYVTTNRGLFKYNLALHKLTVVDGRADNSAEISNHDLLGGFYDGKTNLWVTSRNGLYNYNLLQNTATVFGGDSSSNSHNYFFFDIAKYGDSEIVCASSTGLQAFNIRKKSFAAIHQIADVYNAPCFSVMVTNNTAWAGSDAGILSYDLKTHKSERLITGSPGIRIYPTSQFMFFGGTLVTGLGNLLAYFDTSFTNVPAPSNAYIENIFANNERVNYNGGIHSGNQKLVFEFNKNTINLTFTAFQYNNPAGINFRYRLEGADKNWHYTTNGQRSANYTQLRPGSYVFYVQSGNRSNKWSDKMAVVYFTILPPYWETWWFRLAVAAVVIGALYTLYRYRINHLIAIQKIRSGIADDFHDDLGSTLSSISIYSQVALKKTDSDMDSTKRLLEDIGARARAMIDSMNDLVWAIKPENDTLYKLMQRMQEFSQPVAEAKDIALLFVMDETLFNLKTDMGKRKNLFLFFKEAFNNAAKYSDASAIEVRFKLLGRQLTIDITDNGKGFDLKSVKKGNGLLNMQKRLKEIGGEIAFASLQGKGASVSATCKIT